MLENKIKLNDGCFASKPQSPSADENTIGELSWKLTLNTIKVFRKA